MTRVHSYLPWDIGTFLDCSPDGRSLRLEGTRWNDEVQPMWGSLGTERIDWEDGTSFTREKVCEASAPSSDRSFEA